MCSWCFFFFFCSLTKENMLKYANQLLQKQTVSISASWDNIYNNTPRWLCCCSHSIQGQSAAILLLQKGQMLSAHLISVEDFKSQTSLTATFNVIHVCLSYVCFKTIMLCNLYQQLGLQLLLSTTVLSLYGSQEGGSLS